MYTELETAKTSATPRGQQAQPTPSVRSSRYEKLTAVDRLQAETISRGSSTRATTPELSRALVNRHQWQTLCTSVPLAISDSFVLWAILSCSAWVATFLTGAAEPLVSSTTTLLASLILIPTAALTGLYPALGMNPAVEFRQLVCSAALAITCFAGIELASSSPDHLPVILASLMAFLIAVPVCPAARYFTRLICSRFSWWGEKVLIYASPSYGRELFKRLSRTPETGFRPVGLLISPEDYWELDGPQQLDTCPIFDARAAHEAAQETGATWAIIQSELSGTDRGSPLTGEIEQALASFPNRFVVSAGQHDLGMWDTPQTIGSVCGVRIANSHNSLIAKAAKRGLDLTLTILVLVLGSPVLAAIALAVRWSSPGPIFYSQKRTGLNGKSFDAWKFRSMVANADKALAEHLASDPIARKEWDEHRKLKNDPRITRIGHFIRKTSLDELPQLWNILKGEMSLVGPRPIVNSSMYDGAYITEYPREFAAYTSVRPGLTGLWQVTCRNNGVYEMRIYWDLYYIRNWSIWLDLYILLRTVRTVLLREGAY